MSDEYRLVGDHAENLTSGRMVAPGEFVDADDLDQADRWLVDEGRLMDTEQDPTKLTGDALQQRARDLNIEGRAGMSADELREAIAGREAEAGDR